MKDDEECPYDRTLIDGSSAEGGDKEICSVGETIQTCVKDDVIEMELMQL